MTTTTLLAAANELLLSVGEMEAPDFAFPPAKKARNSILSAIRFTSMLHDWEHLRVALAPLSWVGGVATFAPHSRVISMLCGSYTVRPVKVDSLLRINALTAYTGQPMMYAPYSAESYLFHPTPTAANKLLISLFAVTSPTTPSLPADTLTLPDDFYDAVQTYAQYLMHRNHTADNQAAQLALQDFELRVHMMRTREGSSPSNIGMLT